MHEVQLIQSHVLSRQVPVSETCWASGVRSTQHSAILATHQWCPGTAEKLKDIRQISVIFCSRILERQSQPEKMRAPSRRSINCIVSNLYVFYIICLSHRLHAQDHLLLSSCVNATLGTI